jgi:hypothetical protein
MSSMQRKQSARDANKDLNITEQHAAGFNDKVLQVLAPVQQLRFFITKFDHNILFSVQEAPLSNKRSHDVADLIGHSDSNVKNSSADGSSKLHFLHKRATDSAQDEDQHLSTLDDFLQLRSSAPKTSEHKSPKAVSGYGQTSLTVDTDSAIQAKPREQKECCTGAVENPGRILMTAGVAAQGIIQESLLIQLEDADSDPWPTGQAPNGAEVAVPSLMSSVSTSRYAQCEDTAADV